MQMTSMGTPPSDAMIVKSTCRGEKDAAWDRPAHRQIKNIPFG